MAELVCKTPDLSYSFSHLRDVSCRKEVVNREIEVVNFKDIVESKPFCDDRKVVVFSDLDGVFLKYGSANNHQDNFSRFLVLRDIARKSEKLTFWSSRILTRKEMSGWNNKIAPFPFMSESSIAHLENFVRKSNASCEVSSKIGTRKIFDFFGSDDEFGNMICNSLGQDKNVVVIGSSVVDRIRIRQVSKLAISNKLPIANLFYFDTGHTII